MFSFARSDPGIKKSENEVYHVSSIRSIPASSAGERYIRIGSSKENLRKYPEKEAFLFEVLRHGFPTIENTPSDYQELTFEKLLIYYGAKGLKLNQDTVSIVFTG